MGVQARRLDFHHLSISSISLFLLPEHCRWTRCQLIDGLQLRVRTRYERLALLEGEIGGLPVAAASDRRR